MSDLDGVVLEHLRLELVVYLLQRSHLIGAAGAFAIHRPRRRHYCALGVRGALAHLTSCGCGRRRESSRVEEMERDEELEAERTSFSPLSTPPELKICRLHGLSLADSRVACKVLVACRVK